MSCKDIAGLHKVEFCGAADLQNKIEYEKILNEISSALNITIQEATNMIDSLANILKADAEKLKEMSESTSILAATPMKFTYIPTKNSVNPHDREYKRIIW